MLNVQRISGLTTLTLVIALLLTAGACRREEGDAPPSTRSDGGKTIITEAANFYASLQSTQATMEVHLEFPENAQGNDAGPFIYDFIMEKPSKVAYLPVNEDAAAVYVKDGAQVYEAFLPERRYAVRDDASTLEDMMRDANRLPAIPGADVPLGFGMPGDIPGALAMVRSAEIVGEEAVVGMPCTHVRVTDPLPGAEIWVRKEGNPWIVRLRQKAQDAANLPGLPPELEGLAGPAPGLDVWFTGWVAGGDVSESFDITPPEDFERVDSPMPDRPAPPSAGQDPAPPPAGGAGAPKADVRFQLLDGEQILLSGLRGKVVVLDFWASWCRPCTMALPGAVRTAGEFSEKEVVFIAVNMNEPKSKIQRFLNDNKLKCRVALGGQNIASFYGVRSIPHTVFIDKQGEARDSMVGFGPGMHERFRSKIDSLVRE